MGPLKLLMNGADSFYSFVASILGDQGINGLLTCCQEPEIDYFPKPRDGIMVCPIPRANAPAIRERMTTNESILTTEQRN